MCNNFVVEGVDKKDPLIKLSVAANASHIRHNDFQRSGGDPAAANKVWEYLAFFSRFLVFITLRFSFHAGCLTAFVYQIVRNFPPGIVPD